MEVFKKNSQFIFIIVIWFLSGYGGALAYAVIPLSLFFMKRRNMYMELLIGFFIILTLSDSREDSLQWAANAKNEYIVILALFLFLDRKSFFPLNYFYQRFILFFVFAFLSIFFAPYEILGTSIQKTVSYLLILIIVPNYVIRCHKDHGADFYKTLIYTGTCFLLIGFCLKFVNHYQAYLEGRFRGILGNPNGLGIYTLLLFLTYSVVQELYPKLFETWEKWVIYIALFLSLLMSDSRNSIFAILIFFFFSYFYKLSPYLGGLLFIVFIVAYQYISDNLVFIIEGLGLNDYLRVQTIGNASGRYIAWNFAKDHIRQSIWIGKGFEYTNYMFDESSDWLNSLGHQGNAHNTYLTLWLDTGFFGLIFYVWAFLHLFFRLRAEAG